MGNSFGCSASGERLVSAARDGDLVEAKMLLDCNPCLAKYSTFGGLNSPLHFAAAKGHDEIVALLLQNGADVNSRNYCGQTALMQACRYGHWEVVQTLLIFRCNVTRADYLSGRTALHFAAVNGHVRCIRLVAADFVPSAPYETIQIQTEGDRKELANVKNKSEQSALSKFVNKASDGGITALHMAALNGYFDKPRKRTMGKGKRDSDHTPKDRPLRGFTSPAEAMPYISEMEVFSEEASRSVGPSDTSPTLDINDGSIKLVNAHPTVAHQHQSLGRSIFLKRSRHYYGHQYSRRNSSHHANASSSRGKGALRDDRLSFELASQSNSDIGRCTENRERSFYRPERIHSNSVGLEAVPHDAMKLVCGLCEKPLRRKLYFGNSVSSNELCVVAVLDCGHAYHGDCLEHRTSTEERCDPPCPLCRPSLAD